MHSSLDQKTPPNPKQWFFIWRWYHYIALQGPFNSLLFSFLNICQKRYKASNVTHSKTLTGRKRVSLTSVGCTFKDWTRIAFLALTEWLTYTQNLA